MMKTIIFDVMGNDNGVQPAVVAAVKFVNKYVDFKIILVGDKEKILKYTNETEKIEVFHNPNVVSKNNEDLLSSYKENNSMNSALKLLKENKGVAVLSSGDSGKYLVSSMMILKRLNNVQRPAFMSIIPTIKENKRFILLDEGANLHTTSENIIQWAKLGSTFSRIYLNVETPKVGVLNIGTEDYKGFDFQQEANRDLKKQNGDFAYVGFVESRDLLQGDVDVVVADGYSGNLVLKTMEGTILSFSKLIKNKLTKNLKRKVFSFFLKGAFSDIKEHLDYRNVGAAWVIGVNGIVIKAHGSSDEKAYFGALNQIRMAIEKEGILAHFENELMS